MMRTGNNVIANSHTISTAENGAVIYARIKDPTNACFETRSFAFAGVDSQQWYYS
jgi:hypothetical protein